MIRPRLPIDFIDEEIVSTRLSENNLQIRFSPMQRAYYSLVRPLIPIWLRQSMQTGYHNGRRYNDNFIDNSLVQFVMSNPFARSAMDKLYPQNASSAIVLTHDVETEVGMRSIPTIMDLESKYGFRSSWNIVPYKYPIDEGVIRHIKEMGHEIGIHGFNHDGKLYYSEKVFNERAHHINRALRQYDAVGFRSPMVHRNLLWLQKLDIQYDASCFDYDPFQPFPGGTGSIWPFIAGKFVELPYTLPQDHTLFYVLGRKDIDIWKSKANWVIANHGVVLTLTHPDYLMEKEHLKYYEELLVYLKEIKNAWHCLPRELARWWKEQHGMQKHSRQIQKATELT